MKRKQKKVGHFKKRPKKRKESGVAKNTSNFSNGKGEEIKIEGQGYSKPSSRQRMSKGGQDAIFRCNASREWRKHP